MSNFLATFDDERWAWTPMTGSSTEGYRVEWNTKSHQVRVSVGGQTFHSETGKRIKSSLAVSEGEEILKNRGYGKLVKAVEFSYRIPVLTISR